MSGDPWPYNQMPGMWPQPCPTCGTCPTCGRQGSTAPAMVELAAVPAIRPLPSPPYVTTCISGFGDAL